MESPTTLGPGSNKEQNSSTSLETSQPALEKSKKSLLPGEVSFFFSFLAKHWQGNLSLGASFWLIFVLITVAVEICNTIFSRSLNVVDPSFSITSVSIKIFTLANLFNLFIVYPWQIVGTWRSATRSKEEKNKKFIPFAVKLILFLHAFWTWAKVATEAKMVVQMLRLVFEL